MKKQMLLITTFILLLLAVWSSYYLYREYYPKQYSYGLLVEFIPNPLEMEVMNG